MNGHQQCYRIVGSETSEKKSLDHNRAHIALLGISLLQ
jgi:hypothetical protein